MTPSEIRTYFRELVDEPDETFFTNEQADRYLNIAYGQFRRAVQNIDPLIYASTAYFTLSSSRELDLATTQDSAGNYLLGNSAATDKRLMQLVSLEAVDSASDTAAVLYSFSPVSSAAALTATRFSYSLRGTKLLFSGDTSETMRITYLPGTNVTWSGGTNQLDDLTMFHDMIALYAYAQYAMRDGADSGPIQRQIGQRFAALTEYVQARNLESASYVAQVGWDDFAWR